MVIEEGTLLYIVIRYWAPVLFTVLGGGVLGTVLLPRIQANWSQQKVVAERRVHIFEAVIVQFEAYISSWRRLISIARLEQSRLLTEIELERKKDFIAARNDSRDTLVAELAKAKLYFSRDGAGVINAFMDWDAGNGAKTLDDLPDHSEWRLWEERIAECLRRDLEKR